MADPVAGIAKQITHIEAKTGQSFAALCQLIVDSGLAKVGEQRSMLMQRLGLGYGDANMLALQAKAAAAPVADDPLELIYSGAKAGLRPLHEALIARIDALGGYEKAAKKGYVSLRRKKQFAMLGPANQRQLELGLNAKALADSPRLKAMPAGGMCQYTLRLSTLDEIDAELLAWLAAAFQAAG